MSKQAAKVCCPIIKSTRYSYFAQDIVDFYKKFKELCKFIKKSGTD